jgi:cytochrome c oxidase assembly protein subunit 15
MPLGKVVARRISPAAYRRLAMVAVVAIVGLILTGAAVRLTGSGLGCPKWPTCSTGHIVAPSRFHPAVEFANRVLTGTVSVALALAALGAFLRSPRRRDLCWLGCGLAAGLVAEAWLGGVMVQHRLQPGFVMAHFLLSITILLDAVVLHHRASLPDARPWRPPVGRDLVRLGRVVPGLVLATIVAGTVVTGAGPHSGANSSDGTVAARWHLDLHRVTQVHGALAMLTLAVIGGAWWMLRSRGAPAEALRRLQQLTEALCAQVAIGYTQYFSGVPPVLVAFHVLGAATVWVLAVRFSLYLGSGAGLEAPVRDAVVTRPAPAAA